ncbi:hypothetical protein, partial [Rathayibacter sp. AY2B7]|uniref:hypothetical protein n=1 Tax=Rathayibacter sp. AY2B7 TaxID=2080571 RepID=UPI001CA4F72A
MFGHLADGMPDVSMTRTEVSAGLLAEYLLSRPPIKMVHLVPSDLLIGLVICARLEGVSPDSIPGSRAAS